MKPPSTSTTPKCSPTPTADPVHARRGLSALPAVRRWRGVRGSLLHRTRRNRCRSWRRSLAAWGGGAGAHRLRPLAGLPNPQARLRAREWPGHCGTTALMPDRASAAAINRGARLAVLPASLPAQGRPSTGNRHPPPRRADQGPSAPAPLLRATQVSGRARRPSWPARSVAGSRRWDKLPTFRMSCARYHCYSRRRQGREGACAAASCQRQCTSRDIILRSSVACTANHELPVDPHPVGRIVLVHPVGHVRH